jgi:hypothetical protein
VRLRHRAEIKVYIPPGREQADCAAKVEKYSAWPRPRKKRISENAPMGNVIGCHSEPVRTLAWESVLPGRKITIATPVTAALVA